MNDFLNGPGGLLIGLIFVALFVIAMGAVLHLFSPRGYGMREKIVRELPPKEGYKVLRVRNGGRFTSFSDEVPYTEVDTATRTYRADRSPTTKNKNGIYSYYNRQDAIDAVEGAKSLQAQGRIGSFSVVKFNPKGNIICYEEIFRCEEASDVKMEEFYPSEEYHNWRR